MRTARLQEPVKKEELYQNDQFVAEARQNPMGVDMLSDYANQLHLEQDVVADLVFAHEADAREYSDDDFADLGGKVWQLMRKCAAAHGLNPEKAKSCGKLSALADFNGWYLEKVHYAGQDFEAALSDYLKASPYIVDR